MVAAARFITSRTWLRALERRVRRPDAVVALARHRLTAERLLRIAEEEAADARISGSTPRSTAELARTVGASIRTAQHARLFLIEIGFKVALGDGRPPQYLNQPPALIEETGP